VPGERGPDNRGDADRVLVQVRLDVIRADRVLARLERDDPRLYVEVAAELLPDDVHVAPENEVGAVDRLSGLLAPLAPLPLQGERAEHDRLRGALSAGAGGLSRRVEQLGQHPDAALLDLRRHRILGVVDEVPVQVLVDHRAGLGLHPGGDEGGQVSLGDPLHGEFLLDQPHRLDGGHRVLGDGPVGRTLGQEGARRRFLDGWGSAHVFLLRSTGLHEGPRNGHAIQPGRGAQDITRLG
jgi:hypothetical protein